MVAANPSAPAPERAEASGFFLDPSGMALPGVAALTNSNGNASALSEDPNKKIRKPYTITKSRESWTEQEHDKFLEALQLFDRDWKKIEAFVGSKTVIQIRSHAQKYFLKVQKNGTSEHVPPPRPKRKAAHPYPQKASKNAPLPSQAMAPFQSSSFLLEPGYTLRTDSSSLLRNSTANATVSSWTHNSVVPLSASHVTKDDIGPAGCTMGNNCCCSSTESAPGTWPTCETADQVNHGPPVQAMPDFAQVYSFIGSVFDPNTTGHSQKLKEMDPIDVETILLLMRNLSVNLSSSEFEDHRRLLSSYDVESEESKPGGADKSIHDESEKAPSRAKGN
ncbi:hypothetical protein MRB53_025959 [Persea americana]|uniref:Uncharacterized protein n=1 Tax=Persea americana TaxID=3435 RepID=A0ACC2LHM2_PERAE|nr:hypothetical protein MRB53_025959 [Persea americana]